VCRVQSFVLSVSCFVLSVKCLVSVLSVQCVMFGVCGHLAFVCLGGFEW
jgi:hypothetical protein